MVGERRKQKRLKILAGCLSLPIIYVSPPPPLCGSPITIVIIISSSFSYSPTVASSNLIFACFSLPITQPREEERGVGRETGDGNHISLAVLNTPFFFVFWLILSFKPLVAFLASESSDAGSTRTFFGAMGFTPPTAACGGRGEGEKRDFFPASLPSFFLCVFLCLYIEESLDTFCHLFGSQGERRRRRAGRSGKETR